MFVRTTAPATWPLIKRRLVAPSAAYPRSLALALALVLLLGLLAENLPPAAIGAPALPANIATPTLALPQPRDARPGTAALDRAAPGISAIAAFTSGPGRALLAWHTDQPYRQTVAYGPTTALGAQADPATIRSERLPNGGYQHQLALAVQPGQTYFYRIAAADEATGATRHRSALQNFATAGGVPSAPRKTGAALFAPAAAVSCATSSAVRGLPAWGREPGLPRPESAGAGITLTNGELFSELPLISLDGKGLPVAITLHYTTANLGSSNLGSTLSSGWSHSYLRRLCIVDSTSNATLTTEDGRTLTYVFSAGSYTTPTGALARLTRAGIAPNYTYTLTYRTGEKDIFNSSGLLTEMQDPLGNRTTLSYSSGRIQTITNVQTGQDLFFSYGTAGAEAGKLIGISDDSDPLAVRSVALQYDTSGRLSQVRELQGGYNRFTYDGSGRLYRAYDPNNDPATPGAVYTQTTYDASNRVTSQLLADGTTLDLLWSTGSSAYDLQLTYNAGQTSQQRQQRITRYLHDSSRNITRAYLPVSDSSIPPYESYTYNANNQVTQVTEAINTYTGTAGALRTYSYDLATGDLLSISDGYNYTTTIQYNTLGRPLKIVEPTGGVHRTLYDSTATLPMYVSDPLGNTTAYTYDASGLVTNVIQPDGVVNTQQYDTIGYPTNTTLDASPPTGTTGTILSQGKTASASSAVSGSEALYGNDGDTSTVTRWTAASTASGQWWQVDLGKTYSLRRMAINWFNANGVVYKYRIETSTTGASFTTAVDRTGNTALGIADVTFGPVAARYVRVTITGVSSGGAASAYEFRVYGTANSASYLQLPSSNSLTANGWLSQLTNWQGVAMQYTSYSAAGLPGQVTFDPSGRSVVNQPIYDNQGQIKQLKFNTSATAADEKPTIGYDYDALGRLTEQIDALNNAETYSYNSFDELIQATDKQARPVTISYLYDALGSVKTTTDNLNYSTTEEYDVSGRLSRRIDARNVETTFSYFDNGWLSAESVGYSSTYGGAATHTTSYSYDTSGRLASITDPLGKTTTYIRDAAGRVTEIRYHEGNKDQFSYDELSRVTLVTAGAGATNRQTRYLYDAVGRQSQVIVDPAGLALTTTYSYTDPATTDKWNLQRVTDPRGKTTRYRYDSLGQIVQVIDAANNSWSFSYDNLGRLISKTDPLSRTTSYDYDILGRLTSLTNPLSKTASWTYNADDTIATHTDFAGRVTTYGYDGLGRRTSITYDDAGATGNVSLTLDAHGNVTSMTDGLGTTTYTYDAYNQLDGRTRSGKTIKYTRGYDGRILTIVWDTLTFVSNTYDGNGRVSSATEGGLTQTYTYNAADQVTSVSSGGTTNRSYTYDSAGRLVGISYPNPGGGSTSFSYTSASFTTLDANGNRLVQVDSEGTTTYTYDDLNRLTKVVYPAFGALAARTVEYTYDAVGNRLTEKVTQGGIVTTTSSTYNADDRLVTMGGSSFTYDDNGNMLTGFGGESYTWDRANRLKTSAQAGGVVHSYGYDGQGNRVRLQISGGSYGSPGTTIDYALDETGALALVLAEQRSSDGSTNLYASGPTGLSVRRRTSGGTSTTDLLRTDGLGSVRQLGSSTAVQSFDAWGSPRSTAGTWTTTAGYAGELGDEASGLRYLRARYYDSRIGRFISRDTYSGAIDNAQTMNLYSYAVNNPVNMIDPSGNRGVPVRAPVRVPVRVPVPTPKPPLPIRAPIPLLGPVLDILLNPAPVSDGLTPAARRQREREEKVRNAQRTRTGERSRCPFTPGEAKMDYDRDSQGRVIEVRALSRFGNWAPRRRDKGKLHREIVERGFFREPGDGPSFDQAGHIIASVLGGPDVEDNLVPMAGRGFNLSVYKSAENYAVALRAEFCRVQINVTLDYTDTKKPPRPLRPRRITYEVSVPGMESSKLNFYILNPRPGEKK